MPPTAPPTRCTDPECSNYATHRGRCDHHQPTPWAGRDDKTARYGISSGRWRTLKRAVTRRDHGCCYRCGADQADTPEEPYVLDHITPIAEGGSPTDLDNLGLLCGPCDQVKSRDEAQRGAQRARERARTRHT
ncbi:HNH endonuclease [Streptomyces sp. DSM 42041]|uniref:HNH endonuclease n=1 Tax=Streptomyces hazeniae TaxID=3075538 RepID=A0ABU2NWP8_9ACTN|nr:HNH endonuclease [Streptomyces sp. DSM 42041]MDT0381421.1 HNH endonuclease [Streptomyces sp. DSM 42041]